MKKIHGVIVVLCLLFWGSKIPAQGEKPPATANRIDFKVSASIVDPFSEGNQESQKTLTIKRGEIFTIRIEGTPKPGFHTYPITQRSEAQDENGLSTLSVAKNNLFIPLFPIQETEPEWKDEGVVGFYLEHEKPFVWSQDILVTADAKPGAAFIKFMIKLQVCDTKCVWGEHHFEIPIEISKADAVPLSKELSERLAIQPTPAKVVPRSEGEKKNNSNLQKKETGGGETGLLAFALQGVFWGAISLVTPCVFPMIPITVSYFLKQSEKTNHRPVAMALVYSFTIVTVLTISAVALLSFFRLLSVHPLMNFGLGALFVFFALSLLGMYEIELPSGLAHFTTSRQGQGGFVGTIFMALTFTIVSFACVAPFLGGFGGTAANSNITFAHRVLGGFAFSITFASPFFVLALFPGMLKQLPKSGNWLNSVKVVMGFLELAAAVKFFRAGELVYLPETLFFTYDFSMAVTIMLAFGCGLYLLGFLQMPHDTPSDHLSVPGVVMGILFLSLGLYLAPSMIRQKEEGSRIRPHGAIFAWVDSFLLPEESDDLPFIGDLNKGLEEARKQGKMVFIDFTGVTCTNCKINEANVFPLPNIRDQLKKFVLVQLYTDRVPDKFYSAEERAGFQGNANKQRQDASKNLDFQKKQFNTEQLPLYVIIKPAAQGGDFQEISRYDEGKINDVTAFENFLRNGLNGK